MIRNQLYSQRRALVGSLVAMIALPAFAHDGSHAMMSFSAGFVHPLSGLDHLLAMLAIGLWIGQSQRAASSKLLLVFSVLMAFSAFLGQALGALPAVELGVAASVAVIGGLVAGAVRLPGAFAGAVIGIFALAHGYVHGVELPNDASASNYVFGFISATIALQSVGIVLSRATDRRLGNVLRLAGATIAVAGAGMLAALV